MPSHLPRMRPLGLLAGKLVFQGQFYLTVAVEISGRLANVC
jgi:hypothetical protein